MQIRGENLCRISLQNLRHSHKKYMCVHSPEYAYVNISSEKCLFQTVVLRNIWRVWTSLSRTQATIYLPTLLTGKHWACYCWPINGYKKLSEKYGGYRFPRRRDRHMFCQGAKIIADRENGTQNPQKKRPRNATVKIFCKWPFNMWEKQIIKCSR